jgi:hypothetical protein
MSGKMNWWRAGKDSRGASSIADERERLDRDKAAKWIDKTASGRKWPTPAEIRAKRTKRVAGPERRS